MKRIALTNKPLLSEEQKNSITISSAAKLEVADFFKRLFFIGLIVVLTTICITSFAKNTSPVKDSVQLKRHHQLGINLSTPILMLGAGQSRSVIGQLTYKSYFKNDKRALRLDFIYTNTYDEFTTRGGSVFTNQLSGKADTIYGGYSTSRREIFSLSSGIERKFKSKVVDVYVATLAHFGVYKIGVLV